MLKFPRFRSAVEKSRRLDFNSGSHLQRSDLRRDASPVRSASGHKQPMGPDEDHATEDDFSG